LTNKAVIGDLIKILLDDCFYIENEAAVRGKPRIDLNVDSI